MKPAVDLNISNPLKIGLIGCGRAAEVNYLRALNKIPDAKVVAVVDPIKKRRELLSKKLNNCNNYISLGSNLAGGTTGPIQQVDAAIITTPPDTHIPLASEFLKRDKFVLIEKPLAPSTKGIKELLSIEASSKASLMMGFNHRYWKPVIDLKDKLFIHPKIDLVEMIFTSNYNKWNPVSYSSDPLDDLGPHVFDLIRYIFKKEIVSISANKLDKNILDLKIKISEEIQVLCHIAHSNESIRSIKVETNDKKYHINHKSVRISSKYRSIRKFFDLGDRVKRIVLRQTSPIKNTYEMQLKNFINLIRLNIPADPNIEDGVAAILAVEATQKSISKRGREIYLNEIK